MATLYTRAARPVAQLARPIVNTGLILARGTRDVRKAADLRQTRMPARILVIVIALAAGVALRAEPQNGQAKRRTLVEQAREFGGEFIGAKACGFVNGPPTLESLLKQADVVVHGTVVAAVGRLSDDQLEVWTDYTIQPTAIVHGRPASLAALAPSEPTVFTARGGVVVVDGLRIAVPYQWNGTAVQLHVGQAVVLFGRQRDGRFELEAYDVFTVDAGMVRPNGHWPHLTADGSALDLDTFLYRVMATAVR